MVYYNEFEPYAAQWLQNLSDNGHIAKGYVDSRSILDVRPEELKNYEQCHFFAGIGIWSHALRLAGWPDDRPVWTGSCPCQPFSSAGSKRGVNDERHLWPCWFELIKENKPPVIFGEQVAAAIGHSWLDHVFANLESIDYTVGAAVLTAAGFGAPHVRPRLFFVAYANGRRPQSHDERWQSEAGKIRDRLSAQADTIGHLRESNEAHGERGVSDGNSGDNRRPQPTNGFWRSCEWFRCSDTLWRPVEPGTFPLAHGNSSRVGRLRAYGNAIVPQVAAEMIMAYMAYEKEILGNS